MLIESYNKLDEKRRVIVPAKIRKELGKEVAITRDIDGCLNIYSLKKWEAGETKAQTLNKSLSIKKDHRLLSRFLTSGERVDVDASGRILIPEQLTQFAGLKEKIVFAGTEEGIQIWDATKWDGMIKAAEKEIQKIAEQYGE